VKNPEIINKIMLNIDRKLHERWANSKFIREAEESSFGFCKKLADYVEAFVHQPEDLKKVAQVFGWSKDSWSYKGQRDVEDIDISLFELVPLLSKLDFSDTIPKAITELLDNMPIEAIADMSDLVSFRNPEPDVCLEPFTRIVTRVGDIFAA
jgi:hypothetical protein